MSMNRMRTLLVLLLSAAWLDAAGTHRLAAQLVPLGPEIDLQTAEFPEKPLLAAHPNGDCVVAWWYNDPLSLDLTFYTFITAGGKPRRGLAIYSPIEWPQVDAVTATPTGFDVIFHAPRYELESPQKTFYLDHLNRRGVRQGRRIRLGGTGFDWVWQIPGNGFVAGWALPHAHGIAARRLSASGKRVGSELLLNSRPVDEPHPVFLALPDGGFVSFWLGTLPGSVAGSSSTLVLRARRFSATGTPLGPDFDVNTTPLRVDWSTEDLFVDSDYQVAVAPDGGFAVAWAYDLGIYLRFFDATGQALGPEVPVEVENEGYIAASIAFDPAGNLLLLWLDDSREGLRLRLFDSHGVPLGPPTGVRSRASGIYTAPFDGRVAWAGDSWIVTWMAAGAPQFDFENLFVRRFAVPK